MANTATSAIGYFGLGTTCEADVTITWLNAGLTTQSFHLIGNARYQVVEGQEPVAAR